MQIHALLYLKLLVPAALRDCEINILRLKEFFMQTYLYVILLCTSAKYKGELLVLQLLMEIVQCSVTSTFHPAWHTVHMNLCVLRSKYERIRTDVSQITYIFSYGDFMSSCSISCHRLKSC